MTVMLINLVLVYVASLYARFLARPVSLGEYGLRNRPSFLPALVAALSLTLVAGLRNNIGDTFTYMHSYRYGIFTWETIDYSKDFGFNIMQLLLRQISGDPQLLIFVTAAITTCLIAWILYHYSRMYELSLYLYITTGMFTTSMNGIRQFMAAAIIFAGTKYVMNGDWKRFFLLVLLASTVHRSALVLLPIYFLVRKPAWTKQTFLLIGVAVLIVLGFNQFMGTLFTVLADTQYSHYSTFSEGGASYIRVLIAAGPLTVAFYGREKLKSLAPKLDPIINLSLINALFLLIATQNWIFARFSIYFGLYQLLLIPWIIKVFREKDQKLVYYLILLFYLFFFLYECIIAYGGLNYGSRYLVF
ncbi:EpsG family protein [Gorillibacterium timonense]|uniref:EpsG family protein n=1 Tax=Gorillibacterium timonense TaxID=1689269 RepID=UPI00071D192B|nr:EpsG family protein [Gorillibacterium timonense]